MLKIDRSRITRDQKMNSVVFPATSPVGTITVSVSIEALRKLGEADPVEVLRQYESVVMSVASKKFDDQGPGPIVWIEAVDLVGG